MTGRSCSHFSTMAPSSQHKKMPDNDIRIRVADWSSADRDELKDIRRRVFIEEQAVPAELEWDESDDTAIHFLATINDKSIACARMKTDGQIGRMAVLAEYRNRGIGDELLQAVLQQATEQKLKEVYLHAQVSAIPFYERQGFIASGEIFYEADIPHREMRKNLC
jgi:predicted GNAT family N-acyltransferase